MAESRPPTEGERSSYGLGRTEGVRECIAVVDQLAAFTTPTGTERSMMDESGNTLAVLRARLVRLLSRP